MGRSYTIPIVIEVELYRGTMSPLHWKRSEMGAPTAANLTAVIEKYNASFAPGGCNYYPTAKSTRDLPVMEIVAAKVVRVATGEVLATYDPAGDVAEGFATYHVEGI